MGANMSEEQPRSGWRRGFVWGCLTPLIVVGLLVVAGMSFDGYYAFFGYKSDAGYQKSIAAVQNSPVAKTVLGDNIALSGFPTYSFRYDTSGHHESYTFAVQGSRATGTVSAYLEGSGAQIQIKTLVLTGPTGQNYNLIGTAAPGTNTNLTL